MSERPEQWRMTVPALLVLAVFAGLGARLFHLHWTPNEHLRAQVQRNRALQRPLPVTRGRILDRNGAVLAMDIVMRDVWVDPEAIARVGHSGFVTHHLARLLLLDPAVVGSRVQREGRRYEMIRRFVPEETAGQVLRLQLPGVYAQEVYRRTYPHGTLMSHVIGFTNLEDVGSAGIEQAMNRYLKGNPGLLIGEKDGRRHEVYERRSLEISPQPGSDVRLTLDLPLQHLLEQTMDRAVERHRPQGAWAILQRTRTGEILAMAGRPAFDPNAYREADADAWRNRAVAFNYEPGSTFKVAVIAAALNEGLVTPEQIVDCENGLWHYAGRSLRDVRPNGLLTVADVIKKSSNIGTAKIALLLGPERLHAYLAAFGFGRPTGIDLPGEEKGILHPVREWSALSITRIAMGHEVAVTSLQLLNAVNAIANDGFLMKPYVIERVALPSGQALHRGGPEVLSRPISPETAALMRRLMTRVTESGGTGARAAVEGYQIAGKTGTAQKAVPGGYSSTDYVASFVGFFPADTPEISLVVIVDTPRGGTYSGGAVAGPLFREIAEETIRYLAAQPDPIWAAFKIRAEG